jgi:predicted GNAT superfamily acetyltransferase
MQKDKIVAVKQEDLTQNTLDGRILALNNAHAQELSWLDASKLTNLIAQASVAWRIGSVDAFLLAFDQEAPYDNPNFQWFHSRYARFIYIDRVVVASSARGRGYARQLYEHLIAFGLENGQQRLVCEVNTAPPNPASDAFHASMGFVVVGTATIHDGLKTVQYFERRLVPDGTSR